MEHAMLTVQGTGTGFLAVGLSIQHLWINSPALEDKHILIKSNDSQPAFRCVECKTVVLPGAKLP